MIKKGTWVEIVQTVLEPSDRSSAIPEETKSTPLYVWAKGYLKEDSEVGAEATITTVVGRELTGTVTEVNPGFNFGYGDYIPEIAYIGAQARSILRGDK